MIHKLLKYILIIPLIIILSLSVTDNIIVKDVTPIIHRVAKKVDPRQLFCMASNIFYEAGNESLHGQAAVARVVINRIHHGFASTPCGVINQKTVVDKDDSSVVICQFSWVCDESLPPLNKNTVAYKNAEKIAYEILAYDGFKDVIPSNVLFFHNNSVNPEWPYRKVTTIGNHVFYSKHRKLKNEQIKK